MVANCKIKSGHHLQTKSRKMRQTVYGIDPPWNETVKDATEQITHLSGTTIFPTEIIKSHETMISHSGMI